MDRPEGLDFGAIKLTGGERAHLSANSVLAVEERVWDQSLPACFSDFALLGLPYQNMELTTTGEAGIQPVYLRLEALATKPAQYAAHTDPMWYFKVMEPARPDLNIKGMSGCPVFAFEQRPEQDVRAVVCGVQSSWYSGSRITAATDLRFAADLLRQVARRV